MKGTKKLILSQVNGGTPLRIEDFFITTALKGGLFHLKPNHTSKYDRNYCFFFFFFRQWLHNLRLFIGPCQTAECLLMCFRNCFTILLPFVYTWWMHFKLLSIQKRNRNSLRYASLSSKYLDSLTVAIPKTQPNMWIVCFSNRYIPLGTFVSFFLIKTAFDFTE